MGLNRNWTSAEEEYLKEAWGTTSIVTIMKNLNRSRNAIDVKARAIMGTGNFGDNRPERKIKQYNVMNTEERIQTNELLTRLAGLLHKEFKDKLQATEWGQYFQKDMCQNFSNACLQTAGCDECLNYKRIQPQACKMCGITFWEKKENTFCSKCRNMRKIQYLKKRAAIGSRSEANGQLRFDRRG